MYFQYGEKEIEYLKGKDSLLSEVIDRKGFIRREIEPDLFVSLVHQIAGQQISNRALETVWGRINNRLGKITAENVYNSNMEGLGLSPKKVFWIKDFARKILEGEFDLNSLYEKSDKDVIKNLCTLNGVGIWTAEMTLIFSMGRKNILSFGDFGIKNGMKILYNYSEITKDIFEEHRENYAPYGTVASFYLWAVSSDGSI